MKVATRLALAIIVVGSILTITLTYDANYHDWFMKIASIVGTVCALILVRIIIRWYHTSNSQ